MTAPGLAMTPQVTTALISAGVALVVALLGIAGAIAAQLLATRRVYANSLALFERQHAAQETSSRQERAEAARREEEQRFADERRILYAKFLRLAGEVVEAQRTGDDWLDTAVHCREKEKQDPTDERRRQTVEAHRRSDECASRARAARRQLEEVATEIELLATQQVGAAASRLYAATRWAKPAMLEYPDARDEFVHAARRELGISTGELLAADPRPGLDHGGSRGRDLGPQT